MFADIFVFMLKAINTLVKPVSLFILVWLVGMNDLRFRFSGFLQ